MSPRPFALHLMLATLPLGSSKIGLPHWSSALLSWNTSPAWPNIPEDLARDLRRYDAVTVGQAVDQAALTALAEFARGIEAYRRHPYRRADEKAKAVWSRGEAMLLDHGPADETSHGGALPPVVFAPSLINRGLILDLVPGCGMLSWLALQGLHPFRMEWGRPGEEERHFNVGDYVQRRLEPALEEVIRRTGQAPVLVGYCMGGLLALAAAVRRPELVRALVLMAAPWDFHADGATRGTLVAGVYRATRPTLGMLGEVPIDFLQAWFAVHDPIVALRKFRRFAALDPASPEAISFVALEDWLNDGVPLSLPVADEALLGWYGDNVPSRGEWRVDGVVIDPGKVIQSTLVVVPGADRIVMPASAAAVLSVLRRGDRLDLELGHIGMVVGRRAEQSLWRPLTDWIRGAAKAGG